MEHSSEALQAAACAESRGIDRDQARAAVELALPLIEGAMREPRYGDSGFLHIVVADPARTPDQVAAFEDAILFEHSVGDRARWDADYAGYARGKAEQSWRSGADNAKGAVNLDGLVVGCSGAFEPFDCAYAASVAHCLRALARLAGERG
jgi:hypothetical protein